MVFMATSVFPTKPFSRSTGVKPHTKKPKLVIAIARSKGGVQVEAIWGELLPANISTISMSRRIVRLPKTTVSRRALKESLRCHWPQAITRAASMANRVNR